MISRFIHIAAHDGIFFFLGMNNTQLSVCVVLPILQNVHLCIRKSSYGEGDLPQVTACMSMKTWAEPGQSQEQGVSSGLPCGWQGP